MNFGQKAVAKVGILHKIKCVIKGGTAMKFILPRTKDLRFQYLAEKAEKEGYEILTYENIPPETKGVFVLPFGLQEEELLAAFDPIPEGSRIFCGKGTKALKQKAKEKKLHVTFLLEEERIGLRREGR